MSKRLKRLAVGLGALAVLVFTLAAICGMIACVAALLAGDEVARWATLVVLVLGLAYWIGGDYVK